MRRAAAIAGVLVATTLCACRAETPTPPLPTEEAANEAPAATEETPLDARETWELIESLDDPSAAVRAESAKQLGSRYPAAAEAVPVLLDRLDDPDEGVRTQAADALLRLGASGYSVVLRVLTSRDPRIRGTWFASFNEFVRLGPAIAAIDCVSLFRQSGLAWQNHAAAATLALAPADEIWPLRLAAALAREDDGELHDVAVAVLALHGRARCLARFPSARRDGDVVGTRDAAALQISLLQAENGAVVPAAILAARFGPGRPEVTEQLCLLATDDGQGSLLAARVLEALASAGPRTGPVDPRLAAIPVDRDDVTATLLAMGSRDEARRRLLAASKPPSENTALAFVRAGVAVDRVVEPALRTLAYDGVTRARTLLAAGIPEADVRAAAERYLVGPSGLGQLNAAAALCVTGPPASYPQQVARHLEDGFEGPFAARQLALMGRRALPALAELTRALGPAERNEGEMNRWAAEAIGSFGDDGSPALDALLGVLDRAAEEHAAPICAKPGDFEGMRRASVRLYGRRAAAIAALGGIGPAADKAVPRLRTLADSDADLWLRSRARWALRAIRGE